MRNILFAAVVAVGSVAGAAGALALDLSVLPRDEASLRALDNQQLRIVRRAGAQCAHFGEAPFSGAYHAGARARGCIIGNTEQAIRSSDDRVLQTYHDWLPYGVRYDENRPGYYWQRLVAAR